MARYAVVIEKADGNYSAYVPDLPGCVATGATPEAAEAEIREAIEFHLEGLREDGLPIPSTVSLAEYVEAAEPPRLLTVGELLDSNVVGMWADRADVGDSASFARKLRTEALRKKGE